jgi:rhodanese-related sulfurtransferase
MTITIRKGYKAMLAEAEAAIATVAVGEALPLLGAQDTVFVDLRDPRELEREGKIPGAFHCPRGMLEFWGSRRSRISAAASPHGRRRAARSRR